MDFFARGFETVKCGDDVDSLLVSLFAEKPSGRLGEEQGSHDENDAKDDLEGDGEAPRQVVGTIRCTVVNPVCKHGTESNDASFDTDEETPVGGPAAFCLISGDGRRVHSISNSSDCSSDNELGCSVVPFD